MGPRPPTTEDKLDGSDTEWDVLSDHEDTDGRHDGFDEDGKWVREEEEPEFLANHELPAEIPDSENGSEPESESGGPSGQVEEVEMEEDAGQTWSGIEEGDGDNFGEGRAPAPSDDGQEEPEVPQTPDAEQADAQLQQEAASTQTLRSSVTTPGRSGTPTPRARPHGRMAIRTPTRARSKAGSTGDRRRHRTPPGLRMKRPKLKDLLRKPSPRRRESTEVTYTPESI